MNKKKEDKFEVFSLKDNEDGTVTIRFGRDIVTMHKDLYKNIIKDISELGDGVDYGKIVNSNKK